MIRASLSFAALIALTAPAFAQSEGAKKVAGFGGSAADLVNGWFAEGSAAGHAGDFYDNRDRGHSMLPANHFPQLQQLDYTEQQKEAKLDWGFQRQLLPHPTMGNSSTAAAPENGGCNARLLYSDPQGLTFLHAQYRSNNLYIYPEHKDHDPGDSGRDGEGFGDLFPANTPYVIVSQGSSGSDRPFMQAVALTMAAFPPDVKRELVEKRLLMPVIQRLFRESNKQVAAPEDYLTGKAHPTVFRGEDIDEEKMVRLAHAMTPDSIPPLCAIRIADEPRIASGRDFFEPTETRVTETLGDTPCAVARIFRGYQGERAIQVSAAGSFDLRDRPLKFHWVVLRGDPDKVTIAPSGAGGVDAEITVRYQPRQPVAPGSDLSSSRIDIGVFAESEGGISPPAFLTYYTLPPEHRTYDAEGRTAEVFYGAKPDRMGLPPLGDEGWDEMLATLYGDRRPLGRKLLRDRLTESAAAALDAGLDAGRDAFLALEAGKAKLAEIAAAQGAAIKARQEALSAIQKKLGDGAADNPEAVAAREALNAALKEKQDGGGGAMALRESNGGHRAAIKAALGERRGGGPAAAAVIGQALVAMRRDPEFFVDNAKLIEGVANADPQARGALAAALSEAEFLSILRKAEDGSYKILSNSPQLSDNLRYHLGQLHLAVIGGVLFPGSVQWSSRPYLVDPRLTTPKYWRDVYRYNADGELDGWTRYFDKTRAVFNRNGMLLDGMLADEEGDSLRAVKYQIAEKTRRLEMYPIGE